MRIAVLDDYSGLAPRFADWKRLGNKVGVTFFDRHLHGVDEAADALDDFDIVCGVRERMPFPRELIERLPQLKLILFYGERSRVIDLKAAAERGVTVAYVPSKIQQPSDLQIAAGYPAILELTWALILACTRNLCWENENIRSGSWSTKLGTSLYGRTLGIVGFGRIGATISGTAKAFGMKVIAWSENLTSQRAEAGGATAVSKQELFRQSDVITVHMRLSDRTIGLIGEPEFNLMKRSAVIVNTSRGRIIDEAALVEALRTGRIRAAGLDVFDEEPLRADHPLQKLDNAILTPHSGYAVEKSYHDAYNGMVNILDNWLNMKPVPIFTGDDGSLKA